MPIPVEHTVQMRKFTQWIEKSGGSPRETLDRDRVRAILKLGDSQSHKPTILAAVSPETKEPDLT